MENVSLSLNDIKKAISVIKYAKPYMQDNWYNWIEKVVVSDFANRQAFENIKENFIAGKSFEIKIPEGDSELKKVYELDKPIRFLSKESFKIGRGNAVKDFTLNLILTPRDLMNALEIKSNVKGLPNSYIICCKNKFIIMQMDNKKLEMIKELCKILQLSSDYSLYDCSNYDIRNLSEDNILSNLHRFRKLL